jgi:glycosidase
VHRPRADWDQFARRSDTRTLEGRLYQRLRRLIELRRQHAAFGSAPVQIANTGNEHVFGFVREHPLSPVTVLANFSDQRQSANTALLGLPDTVTDLITHKTWSIARGLMLEPCELLWLQPA